MNNGIDLGIAIIRTWTITEETTDDSDDSDKNASDWHPLVYSLLAILFTLFISFIFYSCYRYAHKFCIYIQIYNYYICTILLSVSFLFLCSYST